MERYNNIVKIEKIKKCLEQGDTETALLVAGTVKVSKINNISDLSILAEAYFQNKFYEKSKKIFLTIYEKSKNRRIVAQLVHLSIKLNDVSDAEKYLAEFCDIAPKDFYRHIFRFSIDKILEKDLDVLIEDLERLKEDEYMENWAYELAKMYHKAGNKEKCLKECSDIILWFGEGIYVDKAKALRAYYLGEIKIDEEEISVKQVTNQINQLINMNDANNNNVMEDDTDEEIKEDVIEEAELDENTMSESYSEAIDVLKEVNNTDISEDVNEVSFEDIDTVLNDDINDELNVETNDELNDEIIHNINENIGKDVHSIETGVLLGDIQIKTEDIQLRIDATQIITSNNQKNNIARRDGFKDLEDIIIKDIEKNIVSDLVELQNHQLSANKSTIDNDLSPLGLADENVSNIDIKHEQDIEKEEFKEVIKGKEHEKGKELDLEYPIEDVKMQSNIRHLQSKYKKLLENVKVTRINEHIRKLVLHDTNKVYDSNMIHNNNESIEVTLRENNDNIGNIQTNVCSDNTEIIIKKELLEYHKIDTTTMLSEIDDALKEFIIHSNIDLEHVFHNYIRIDSVRKQLLSCLSRIFDKGGEKFGLLVLGDHKMGKTQLAKYIAKFIDFIQPERTVKVAMIHAEKLNGLDIEKKKTQLDGCVLIIQAAEQLSVNSINGILGIYNDTNMSTSIILEGSKNQIEHIFTKALDLAPYFLNRIYIDAYTLSDYIGFMQEYLHEREFEIDIEAYEELRNFIDLCIKQKREYNLEDVFSMMHRTMMKAEHRSSKVLYDIMQSGRYLQSDLLVIRKEDLDLEL